MTLRYLSGSNGFVPEATGQVISFSRKPESFAINKYVQYIPAPKVVFLWAKLERDAFARVVTDEEYAWQDGDERPKGRGNQVRWEWVEGRTFRRDYPFTLGWQAQEQAGGGWKPLAAHAAMNLQVAMTNRTIRVTTIMENTANWDGNTATANTLNGGAGNWAEASDDPASPKYLAIRKSITKALRRIHMTCNGAVPLSEMMLQVNPDLAIAMAESPEIHNYLRESPFAMAEVMGERPNPNFTWGLPSRYAGLQIIVEDAVKVTERPKADGTQATNDDKRAFVRNGTTALILSRPGGIDAEYGAPSFSTVQCYHHGGMLKVLSFDDTKNELSEGHVEENFKEVLAAPQAGYLITGCR